MGLGGITRDSIVGLDKLVSHGGDEEPAHSRWLLHQAGGGTGGSPGVRGSEEILTLHDDDKPEYLESLEPFDVELNDCPDATPSASVDASMASDSTQRSGSVTESSLHDYVSATNSRPLDSYRPTDLSVANSRAEAYHYHYQDFQYRKYTEHYSDSVGNYAYSRSENGCKDGERENVFCCLLVPFIRPKASANNAFTSKKSPKAIPFVDFEAPSVFHSPTPHITGTSFKVDHKKHKEGIVNKHINSDTSHTIEKDNGSTSIKGILKVRQCPMAKPATTSGLSNGKRLGKKNMSNSSPDKRHLFPTYKSRKSCLSSHNGGTAATKIDFNPLARILPVPSRKDIPVHQKAQVWWQKYDYDEFKKTGRIISKAMDCGGSEIWLTSCNAWGTRAAKQGRRSSTNKTEDMAKYNEALSKYIGEEKKFEEGPGDDFGEKWWCKFGHSRRGLEHVASSSEGEARQSSVNLAIRTVMEEQRRQRRSGRPTDPNKLRNVAMQYTSWARDLALAAGAADAEAVASGFDPAARSRAHHLAQKLNVTSRSCLLALGQSDTGGGGVAMAVTSRILDENTHFKPLTPGRWLKKR